MTERSPAALRSPGGDALSAAALQPRARQALQRRVAAWFARHARDLPWRQTRDAYRVWVSEIMLQQTQVATVVPYYERFLAAFPDVYRLAAAREEDVLRLWEGLGYYRRAVQLHRAARQVVQQHGGQFPRDPRVAQQLPGIGRYTAGAILSIAYDAQLPVLEANTTRLLARLLAYDGDPRSSAGQRTLWQAAAALLPRRQAGRWNQALMELGATICTPRRPRCDDCPLQGQCAARRAGREDELPQRGPRTAFQQVHAAAVVVGHRNGVLVLKRSSGGRWGGLWDFPRLEFPPTPIADDAARRRWIQHQAAAAWGLRLELGACFATLRHAVTRYRITLDCFTARLARRPSGDYPWRTPEGEIQHATLPQLEQLAMTRTARRIAKLLDDATGLLR